MQATTAEPTYFGSEENPATVQACELEPGVIASAAYFGDFSGTLIVQEVHTDKDGRMSRVIAAAGNGSLVERTFYADRPIGVSGTL